MNLHSYWSQSVAWIRGFALGAARSWVLVPLHLKRRAEMEQLFFFLLLSENEGLSLAPPDLQLHLLPYMVPQILYWKRRLRLWDDQMEVADVKQLGH